MENDEQAHKKFPPKWAWPMSRDPTIICILSNIFKTIWANDFKYGKRLLLSGSAYYGLLRGNTVGYPSESLGSCTKGVTT